MMESVANRPQIILGCMNFGKQVDEKTADRMVGIFLDRGYHELDTAHNYGEGASEEILGRILPPSRREKIYIATKVNPFGGEGLRPESIFRQLDLSLKRLKMDAVDLLYLHAPDLKTRIEVTLETCQVLFRQGKFRELGVSNYASWQVADLWHLCRQNGWVLPTVYQGMYNTITRDVERELFPALRNFGIRFYAYNPLAGGFLTGRYARINETPQAGRFVINRVYMERYWKKSYFDALEVFRQAAQADRISMTQTALRWIVHHSFLKGRHRDGVILAASSLDQWEANLKSVEGELSPEALEAADEAWAKALPDCPPYFRT